ncbi:MAG: beta-galactosidase trimerization domain-containing protein [Bryobacteraceae bacterium]
MALVWPQRTQVWHPALARNTEALQGYYYALLEARIPFDLVHDEDITPERLAEFKVVILPNVALLSGDACAALKQYHANGGSLVATFETSLYNEWGEPRKDFALAEVFGASVKGPVEGPLQNSYLQIERRHPILSGIENTTFLPGPIFRVPIHDIPDPVLTRIPPYPAYPPEFVFPQSTATVGPAVTLQDGAGRVVYFSDDIDRTFWRSWNPDLGRILSNAVRWAAKDTLNATVTGAGLFDVFYWETEPGLALHLVNYTTPALMKGPARAISPAGKQDVRLQMPPGFHPAKATTLSTGKDLPFQIAGSELVFTVPQVGEYEVVAFTRASI